MAKLTNVNVSQEAFEEILNALEAQGVQLNRDNPITITKDISIKGPVNYRQVTIRKDIMQIAAMCYKTPIEKEFEVSNSDHFCKFAEDLYQYAMTGKVSNQESKEPTPPSKPTLVKSEKDKSGW